MHASARQARKGIPAMDKDNRDYKWMAYAGMASTVGALLVAAPAIGCFFGSWRDRKLGADPWGMIVFALMGVAAGFLEVFRIVSRISR